jgi:hypothetical protein
MHRQRLARLERSIEAQQSAAAGCAIIHHNRDGNGGYTDGDGVPVEYSTWSASLPPRTEIIIIEHTFGALPDTITTD